MQKPMSIYTQGPARTGPIRSPRVLTLASETPAPVLARMELVPRSPSRGVALPIEHTMMAVLGSQPRLSETIDHAFRRIEAELGELFARLTVNESRELKLRLELAREGDALAARFNRL